MLYTPRNSQELLELISKRIPAYQIDTSKMKSFYWLFGGYDLSFWNYEGIENWNTSNVTNMDCCFENCKWCSGIKFLNWDTSHVNSMYHMFYNSSFNGDISGWNTSHVENMQEMFAKSEFNVDISNWNTDKVKYMNGMFYYSKYNHFKNFS